MATTERETSALRIGILGAVLTIVGMLSSGPVALVLINTIQSQPPWTGTESFVQAYHPVQNIPYYAGFVLVSGYIILLAAICQIADDRHKTQGLIAVIFTAVFAALIFLNYITQTTLIPAFVRDYRAENTPLVALFSLSNPRSLSWAIEMWGWAFLGAATWIAAPVFHRNAAERITASLMILNGVVSILGGIITSFNLGWVMTPAGIVCYVLWNIIILVLSLYMIASMRKRLAGSPMNTDGRQAGARSSDVSLADH